MNNFRGSLGSRRKDRIPNVRIRELCGMVKGVDERTDENILRWFGHIEIMEKIGLLKGCMWESVCG